MVPEASRFSAEDHAWMAQALRLASLGLWTTSPNPRVGCVLVRDARAIGEGWHERAGEGHAEIRALQAAQAAGEPTEGATAYVTLEPCSHFGRTPPCVDALIAAGIRRVVCAMTDPNPLVAGQGLARLAAAGLETECGLLEVEARELNIGFVMRMLRGRPWVRLKAAMSLDGKTALNNGQSQWITSEAARQDGQRWRARACAILSGVGTILQDDPRLTVRGLGSERQPLKVVVDSHLRTPVNAQVLKLTPVLIACVQAVDPVRRDDLQKCGAEIWCAAPDQQGRVDLPVLLNDLAKRGVNELHVEAGSTLGGALVAARLVDELLFYVAPCLLGHQAMGVVNLPTLAALDDQCRLRIQEAQMVGPDLRILARLED